MAWTAPMTAVANAIFTASQFNTYVRDNLLETAPAKATTPGGYFVVSGTNAISQRTPAGAFISAGCTSTSATFAAPNVSGSAGPAVTVTTGTSALVTVSADVRNSATGFSFMGTAISGASTIAATDDASLATAAAATTRIQGSFTYLETGLTAGSNTFTAVYRASSGTADYGGRYISVIPF